MREDWEVRKWGEVLSIINGKNQKGVENNNGIYPIYGSGGIMGYADDFLCPDNTVIIGRKGNINKPIFVKEKFWNVDTAFGLVSNENILNSKYLFYFCVSYNFEKLNKAVTIPSLTKSDLLNIKINLPPLQTQHQIVEELDCLTSIIEKQKKQLEELDNLAQAIFYDMFGDPIENEKGWKIVKFKNIGNIQGGYAFKSALFVNNGIPILKIGNINSGFFKGDNISYYKYDPSLTKYEIYPNDLVISMTGTVGKDDYGNICIIPSDYGLYYLNQRNAKLIVNDSYNSVFISYVLKDKKVKRELTKNSKGVRQANISNNDILNLNLISPPLPLQQQFASKIEAIEKQKELIKKSIKETEDLFNSRMDYYFN